MVNNIEYIRLENMNHYGFGTEAMKKIKICTHCGSISTIENEFCTECGYRLSSKTLYDIYKERHKVCPSCDTILSDDTDYCPQCGMKINETLLNKKE